MLRSATRKDGIMEKLYYTMNEVCEILHLSKHSIMRKIKEGKIPRCSLTSSVLVPVSFFKGIVESEALENDYDINGFEIIPKKEK